MVWKPHAPWRTSTKPGVSAARCASRPAPPMPSWAPTRKCTPLSSPIAPGASCAFRCALWIASSSKTPAGMPPAGPHGRVLWRNRRACATRHTVNACPWKQYRTRMMKPLRPPLTTALSLPPSQIPPRRRLPARPPLQQPWSEPASGGHKLRARLGALSKSSLHPPRSTRTGKSSGPALPGTLREDKTRKIEHIGANFTFRRRIEQPPRCRATFNDSIRASPPARLAQIFSTMHIAQY